MRQMKGSKIEWVGEIPENWDVSKIKNCFKIINGATPSGNNQNFWDGDIAWITPADMPNMGNVGFGKRFITAQGYQSCGTLLVPAGSIIISSRAPIGKVCISTNPLCTNQGCKSLLRDKDNKFYFYFMIAAQEKMCLMGRGTTFMELSTIALENLEVVIPPLTEQKEIAEYLDEKCGEIDALLADIKDEIETLEQYKRSVITESVTKGLNPSAPMKNSGIEWLGDQPIHWEHFKGKYIFKQRNERGNQVKLQLLSPTQNYGVIPQTLYEELSGMSAVKLNENINLSILKTIHKGDFCISLRSFQGGFEYSQYEGVVSPAYQVFYPTKKVFDGYYKHLFKEKSFIAVMNSYTLSLRDGKNIAFSDFGNTLIPYPPLSEQQEIAEYLDKKCAEIDAVISDKQTGIQTLESYKKSLIYEYVTGKKEVKSDV